MNSWSEIHFPEKSSGYKLFSRKSLLVMRLFLSTHNRTKTSFKTLCHRSRRLRNGRVGCQFQNCCGELEAVTTQYLATKNLFQKNTFNVENYLIIRMLNPQNAVISFKIIGRRGLQQFFLILAQTSTDLPGQIFSEINIDFSS